jgi:uncharacterized protein YcnI
VQKSRIHLGALAAAATVGASMSLVMTAPAFAHTDVEIEPAQAGATDALVTVIPEAHNDNAGATSVRVVLPDGIAPGDVTLVDVPAGWEFTAGDDGYTVSGDELDIGTIPRHQVRVAQLPDEPIIYFRILTTYSDGQVDRWIEEPSDANPEPENPAPGVELAAAAPQPDPPPTSAAPAPPPRATTPAVAAPAPDESGGTGLVVILGIAAVVVALAIATFIAIRRRRAATG